MGEEQNLAHFMKHISQRHGQYINKYYSRTGTLWEGRYKSSAVSTDRYLLACSRYIEMNCVRAGIVKRPEEYDFRSYKGKIGLKTIRWLDFDPLYVDLGKTVGDRQRKYQDWIQESIPKGEWEMIRRSIQKNWTYGDEKFKEKIEGMLGRKFEIKKAGRRSK